MNFSEDCRNFFILCNNGEVYYFNVNKKGEIYCNEFCKLFGDFIPGAYAVEVTTNGFNLQDKDGEQIYSLEDFRNTIKKIKQLKFLLSDETVKPERVYIDEDVRTELLAKEKLKYTESTIKIPGILNEPTEKKIYTKKRKKNN